MNTNTNLPDIPDTLDEDEDHFLALADRRRLRERIRTAFLEKAKQTSRSHRRWFRISEIEPDPFARKELIAQWRASIYSGDLVLNDRSQVLCLSASPLLEGNRLPTDLARGEHFNDIVDDLWMSVPRWLAWFHDVGIAPPLWMSRLRLPYLEGTPNTETQGISIKANQPTAKITKAKPGAKPGWDWEDIELFVCQELDGSGDFADSLMATKGWQSLSDLYALIIAYVEKLPGGGAGSGPAISTLKDHVPQMVLRWRASRK